MLTVFELITLLQKMPQSYDVYFNDFEVHEVNSEQEDGYAYVVLSD